MAKFGHGAGVVVAGEVRETFAAFDGALISGARMCVSVLEAANGSGLPVSQSQKMLKAISSGMTAVVEGRGEMVSAVRHMVVAKNASNLRMEDYGCPEGLESVFSPVAEVHPEPA